MSWLGVLSLVASGLSGWEWSSSLGVLSLVGSGLPGWERKTPGRLDPCFSTLMGSGHFFLTLVAQHTLHSNHSRLHHLYLKVVFDALFSAPSTSLSSGLWILPSPWCSGPATPHCSHPPQLASVSTPPIWLAAKLEASSFQP